MNYDITLKYAPELLRGCTYENLQKLLNHAQQRYFDLRQQSSPHGRVKMIQNPHLFKKVKRDIARIKTILAEV